MIPYLLFEEKNGVHALLPGKSGSLFLINFDNLIMAGRFNEALAQQLRSKRNTPALV